MWTSIITRLLSEMVSFVLDSTICASIGTASRNPAMYRKTTRACRRSAAMTITVPRSPGARIPRHSRKQARNAAASAAIRDFPPLRPATSQPSFAGLVGAFLRPVCFWKMASDFLSSGRPNNAERKTRQACQLSPRNHGPNSAGSRMVSRMVKAFFLIATISAPPLLNPGQLPAACRAILLWKAAPRPPRKRNATSPAALGIRLTPELAVNQRAAAGTPSTIVHRTFSKTF